MSESTHTQNKVHTNVVGKIIIIIIFLNREAKSAVSLDNLCLKENEKRSPGGQMLPSSVPRSENLKTER